MSWKLRIFTAFWVAAVVAAVVYVLVPKGHAPPPPGWTVWRQPGRVRAVLVEPAAVLCGGFEGLWQLSSDGTARHQDLPGTSGSVIVNALVRDGRGRLWAGTSEGLLVRDGQHWRTISTADGLPDYYVCALALTSDGKTLYAGTRGGMVALAVDGAADPVPRPVFTGQDDLPHERISAIIEDRDRQLWVGTWATPEGGVACLDPGGHAQIWTAADGLPHPNITTLLQARDGRMWVACGYFSAGGAAVFVRDGRMWRLERTVPVDELAGSNVRSLFEDADGRMWLGHEYSGITVRQDGRTVRMLTPDDGLPAWEVMTMVSGTDGGLWIGTFEGVAHLTPEAVEALFAPPDRKPGGSR